MGAEWVSGGWGGVPGAVWVFCVGAVGGAGWVEKVRCPAKERSTVKGRDGSTFSSPVKGTGWKSGERNGVGKGGSPVKGRGGSPVKGRGGNPVKGRGGSPVPQCTRLTARTPYPAWTPSRIPTLLHSHTPTQNR